MDKRAFSFALRAAAKITFGTSLIGCGGTMTFEDLDETNNEETTPVDDGDDTPASSTDRVAHLYNELPARTSRTPIVACEGPVASPKNWSVYDADTFACCSKSLAATVPANPEEAWGFQGAPDEATRNCCTQIITPNYDAIWSGQPLTYPAPDNVVAACCVSAHGNTGCTPWGPPVPPRFEPGDFVPWMFESEGAIA